MADNLTDLIKYTRKALEAVYQDRLLRVILYGSRARGEAREDSDVDVLVVLRGPLRPYAEIDRTLDLQMELLDRYGEFVSFIHVSKEEYADTLHPLIRNVHREGLAV